MEAYDEQQREDHQKAMTLSGVMEISPFGVPSARQNFTKLAITI